MKSAEARFLPWLSSLNIEPVEVSAVRGDVSSRRYFRISAPAKSRAPEFESAIVAVYAEDAAGETARFEATTRIFEQAGIRVPRLFASQPELGLLLLEDLGDLSLFGLRSRSWSELADHVERAVAMLEKLSALSGEAFRSLNPPLDGARLRSELEDAQALFLDSPELTASARDRRLLGDALDTLCTELQKVSLKPSHRDFMARNLMLPPDGRGLALIDHQDACLAPPAYDLASLLNDSLFPEHRDEHALALGVLVDRRSLADYRRCAVQRALKASATFVRFAARGSDRHLPLLTPTLERAAYHLEQLPEGRSLPKRVYSGWLDSERLELAVSRLLGRDARLSEAVPEEPRRR